MMRGRRVVLGVTSAALACVSNACSRSTPAGAPASRSADVAGTSRAAEVRRTTAASSTTLKGAYKGAFLMGGALNERQFSGQDAVGAELASQQFNTISPENVLKWERVHPQLDKYDFAAGDQFVDYGVKNKMFIVGHTLVWHSQVPQWVFRDAAGKTVSRDTLLARMRDHIFTVVGRYKGRIHGWDVVNEALNEAGTLRKSPWFTIIGEDYLVKAFQYAHEADPAAELYYNDYSVENAPKRNGAVALIKRLQAAGIPVKAIGLQGHNKLDWPTAAQQDSTISAFVALGLKVAITELDVDVLPAPSQNRTADVSLNIAAQSQFNPYTDSLPTAVQQRLAERYAELFGVYLKHREHMSRVTFWGVSDGDSWLNGWPVRGRTSYPLLFDRNHKPKPAFDAVLGAVLKPRGI